MPHALLTRLPTTLVALALVLATGAAAAAQEGTPGASPAASPVAGGPQVGDAVVLFSATGREEAQVAVTRLVDPFEEVERGARRGFHYVLAELVVENLSDAPYDVNPYLVTVADAEGFTYQATFASRSSEAVAALPDFQPGTLEPGRSASGALFFEVVDGAEVELVVHSDSFERFNVLVDRRADVPAEGEPAVVYDARGDELGTVAVDRIVTGLEETDDDLDLDRGQTAVAVVLTVEATGDDPLASPADAVRVVDELGVAYVPTFAFRSEAPTARLPDFPGEDVEAGAAATGAVIFALPADAVVTYVLYSPEFTKLTIVAQPGEGAVVSGDELEPVDVPTRAPLGEDPFEGTPTGEGTADASPVALSGDCADLQGWVDATGENLAAAEDIDVFADDPDADQLRGDADTLRDVAETQGDIATPAVAEETQRALIALLGAYADLLDDVADRLDDGASGGDLFDATLTEGPFADATTEFTTLAEELIAACPAVDFDDVT